MEKEFVPYDIALAMKELGFDEPCVAVYYGDYDSRSFENGLALEYRESQYYAQKGWAKGVLAPLYQQAFRWFREKYNLFILMQVGQHSGEHQTFYFNVFKYGVNLYKSKHRSATGTYTYKEAEHEALRKLIEIVEENL